ncbi:MAG: alpha/beta fold hydrolase [Burkholderiales bacterium]|jgi:pimeloyl-ACP methyl ester carboxylesterase|nr:alpha/beta fold hydrolase [Burkholderiales bacterium]
MLARALLVAVAIEVLGLSWLGATLAREDGVGRAIGVVTAVALGWRLVVVALTYLVAFLTPGRRAGIAPAGPLALGAGFVAEWAAFGALFAAIQPFARWTMGEPDRGFGPESGPPVLLVHGYLCNRGFWWGVARHLGHAGYRVHTIDLEPVFGDIDGFARRLDERIATLRRAGGGRAIALVGHSMGGLVIRAWLREHGAEGISGVVTVGSPHHGSSLAWLGLGRNAAQMRPNSSWLSALAASEGRGLAAMVVSIYSGEDNFVSPQASARLAGARNVPLHGVGHLAMAFSRPVRTELLTALAEIETGTHRCTPAEGTL